MKQHITAEQAKGLSEKGREKLKKWWKPRGGDFYISHIGPLSLGFMVTETEASWEEFKIVNSEMLPCMSIGQMVEFLDEHLKTDWYICSGKNLLFFGRSDRDGIFGKTPKNRKGELCDALWDAVKEILERGDKES